MSTLSFEGKKIMVVEDEALIAMLTCDYLEELGCVVLGPCANEEKAMEMLEQEKVDAALLDINLGHGTTSFPIAHSLQQMSIPFSFTTGYGENGAKREFPAAPVLSKPFDMHQLQQVLNRVFTPAGS